MLHKRSRRRRRFVVIIAAAAALAFTAFAYTAANIMPPATNAGDGNVAISGYTVSAIAYQLEAGNPENIESVSFTLNAAAGTVYARVVSTAGYTACTGGPLNWTCNIAPNPTVLSADNFRVIATS